MRTFEIKSPDGRFLRHQHESLDVATARLAPGYVVTGEVLGADGGGKGGFVDPVGAGAKSVMAVLLDAHGDELLAWLRGQLKAE